MKIYTLIVATFIIAIIISFYNKGGINNFEKDNTNTIRGFAIVGIILHHISQYLGMWNLQVEIFALSGYLFTGTFLFLSGYGNLISYQKISDKTIKEKCSWLWRKIWNVLLTYILVFLISFLIEVLSGNDLMEAVKPVANLALPGWINWYIKIQILMYLLFFIVYIWRISDRVKQVFLLIFSIILIIALSGLESYWYNTVLCFGLGVIIANNRNVLFGLIKKYKKIYLFITMILFAITFHLSVEIIASLAFCLFIIALDNCFHPRNQVIIWLGNMSFELYLIHLIFVRKLLIDGIVNVDQNICVAIIIAGTICISYMVKKWKKIIDQKIKCNRHSD